MAKDSKNLFERAKERIEEAKEHMREQHERIREDLRFSNPADPQQWSDADATLRNGRPTLTLDRTNQFIRQVSNDMRQNKDLKRRSESERSRRALKRCSRGLLASGGALSDPAGMRADQPRRCTADRSAHNEP